MKLDLVARSTRGRRLVTLGAGVRVEQRTQPGLGAECALEDLSTSLESVQLVGGQPAQRISRLAGTRARSSGDGVQRGEQDQPVCGELHGDEGRGEWSNSTDVASVRVFAALHSTRTMQP